MKIDAKTKGRQVDQVLAMLREMQKWGFSLIQAKSSKQQPIDDQVDQARMVARQLLYVNDDASGGDVDVVAKAIIDVSARTAQDGDFLPRERRSKVACFYIPYCEGVEPRLAREVATEACNVRIVAAGFDVMNVETVFKRGLFGSMRPIGLMVWHRI